MTIIEPKLIEVEPFIVAGLSVMTINRDEFDPNKAKLPTLWDSFYSSDITERTPHRLADSPVYGVYSQYVSDASDFYTLTAGVAVSQEPVGTDLSVIPIQKGQYLVFEDSGEMPQVVVNTWMRIWEYFENNTACKRNFNTDFEVYLGPDHIAIYIGINR